MYYLNTTVLCNCMLGHIQGWTEAHEKQHLNINALGAEESRPQLISFTNFQCNSAVDSSDRVIAWNLSSTFELDSTCVGVESYWPFKALDSICIHIFPYSLRHLYLTPTHRWHIRISLGLSILPIDADTGHTSSSIHDNDVSTYKCKTLQHWL